MSENSQSIPSRVLGKIKLEVSTIGFGLWAAGGTDWGPTLLHPAVTTVIPGIKNVTQAEANIQAGRGAILSLEELAMIDTIVPPAEGRKIWPA